MLGPIIHNSHVVAHLEALGLKQASSVEEIPDGVSVLLRSHGESRAVHEALKKRGLKVLNATCPSVTRIHQIVQKAEADGRRAVIIGTPDHPEVRAIAGWCENPVVCADGGALEAWMSVQEGQFPITMVAQTTLTQEIWNDCIQKAKKQWTNAEIFDTICGATFQRQSEAVSLAEQCDGMVVNRARRRVVGSIRAVEAEERAAKAAQVWESIEEGKHYNGVVKSLTSYGAFVDIGGVDGMVHISELAWSRIKHPSEVVNVGDTVDVFVLSFDPEKKKISLGMKDKTQDPWAMFTDKYQVDDVASVRVVKLMPFGAFAEIVPGVDGLIHISQIADHRIDKPADVLAEGDKVDVKIEGDVVDVKITDIDMDKKKVSLSIRALGETAPVSDEEGSDEE